MTLTTRAAVLTGVLATLACSSPVDVPRSLLGRWATAPADIGTQGWYQRHLTLNSTGSYEYEVRTYGNYPDQARGELSGFIRETGTFRTDGDRLIMNADRLVTWDHFYGDASPERVLRPFSPAPLDGSHFEATSQSLILRDFGGVGAHDEVGPSGQPLPVTLEFFYMH
jgi:hypothetical protein